MAKASSTAPQIKTPKRVTPTDQIPRRLMDPTPDDHLEIITRAIFQAGLSWAIIAAQWPTFRIAFEQFQTARVAAFGPTDIDRLMMTDGIVHSAKKIAGTIDNAKTLIALAREFGNIEGYVARFTTYAELRVDVHKRFAFVGDLSCYYWLFRTGQPVPQFEDWIAGQPKDHPRVREMVMAGRAAGTSSERAGF